MGRVIYGKWRPRIVHPAGVTDRAGRTVIWLDVYNFERRRAAVDRTRGRRRRAGSRRNKRLHTVGRFLTDVKR